MSKEQDIWDNMAESFHALSSKSKAHKDKYLAIAKIIMDRNPANILDLGCGSGLLENELIKLGYRGEIYAVDGSTEMLRIAQSICGDRVNFINMDFDNDFNIHKKFEVVVAINVLFFIKEKKKFLGGIKELLKDHLSLLILVNPKPNEECSNWQFVKAHFSNTTFAEKAYILFNELFNLPRYLKMVRGQASITKMAKKGKIVFDRKDDIKALSDSVGLRVKVTEDIHAGQNWLFMMERI